MKYKSRDIYTKEFLEPIVKEALSFRDVCIKLGVSGEGTMHNFITDKIKELKLDTSHFLGRRRHLGIKRPNLAKFSPDKILVLKEGEFRTAGHRLSRALKEIGREYKCEQCHNLGYWNNKSLTLEVDHINDNRLDNRSDNLRFLCPNCHAQKPRKKQIGSVLGNGIQRRLKHVGPKGIESSTLSTATKFLCSACNEFTKTRRSKICLICYNKERDKIPLNLSQVFCEVSNFGYEATGRKYGISGQAIRKRLRKEKFIN